MKIKRNFLITDGLEVLRNHTNDEKTFKNWWNAEKSFFIQHK